MHRQQPVFTNSEKDVFLFHVTFIWLVNNKFLTIKQQEKKKHLYKCKKKHKKVARIIFYVYTTGYK